MNPKKGMRPRGLELKRIHSTLEPDKQNIRGVCEYRKRLAQVLKKLEEEGKIPYADYLKVAKKKY